VGPIHCKKGKYVHRDRQTHKGKSM
jgi:hypothetical protein